VVKQKSKPLVRMDPMEDRSKDTESISGNTKSRAAYKDSKGTYRQ